MVRVLAVNNYPTTECFEKLRKSLTENGAEVTSTDWTGTGASRFNEFDGVALSGAPDMMSEENAQKKFIAEVNAIRDAQVPLLGVCFGHQLMAHAFGSGVVKDKENVLKVCKDNCARAGILSSRDFPGTSCFSSPVRKSSRRCLQASSS